MNGIEAAVREVGDAPAAVGVGMPSQIDFASGTVLSSVNIPLEGVGLRDELSGRLGAPVFVDNDANCAALAEAKLRGARHLLMLTLGTGVGGGIVIDGATFRGASGLGAELGHVTIQADGPACPGNCPNRGCLEALCSGTALERDATELGQDRPESRLGRIYARPDQRVSGREAVAAAQEGDADALELFARLGRNLGVGIAAMINAFEPEQLCESRRRASVPPIFEIRPPRPVRSRRCSIPRRRSWREEGRPPIPAAARSRPASGEMPRPTTRRDARIRRRGKPRRARPP